MDAIRFAYARPGAAQDPVTIDLAGFDDADTIVQELRANETFFEIDLLEHIQTAGPHGGIYLDVGANIGNHAVYFGKFCADHVVALEPHPALVSILRRNLERNCAGRFTLMATAVSDRPGVGRMTLRNGFEKNIGGSQVQALDAMPALASGVPITTLDDLLEQIVPARGRAITLMKVDVEGMEMRVFSGARRLLMTHRPQVVVELATGEARSAVRAFLAGLGYEDSGLRFGWTPTYHFIDRSVHRLRPYAVAPRQDPAVEVLKQVTDELLELVPAGQSYLFVDQDQWWAGLAADGRTRVPFTERDGVYWGPPKDDAAALEELQRLRALGARYIVFAAPAFWWLDHYRGLIEHLRSRHRLVLQNERLVAYELI